MILAAINIIRSPTGRAFLAIRDSETAARSMGIDTARYKTTAFAISAAITGIAGVLYAHKLSFISPEMFSLSVSIDFVMIIIIGGIAQPARRGVRRDLHDHGRSDADLGEGQVPSCRGGDAGAASRRTGRAHHPGRRGPRGRRAGLKSLIFGLIIILFIIFEPMGLDGRWLRVKTYFRQFPLYRPDHRARQRMFLKSERNR